MTCKEFEILLPALLEGELSADESKRVRDHLMKCPSCSKALEDLKASGEIVRNLEEVEPPPWLKTRVMARVREEAVQKESILRKLFYPLHIKIPIQAVATVLIAVVAWNVYKTGEPEFRQIAPPPAVVQEAPHANVPSTPAKAPESAPVPPALKKEAGERAGLREKKALAPSPSENQLMRQEPAVQEAAKADAVKTAEPIKAAEPEPASVKDEEGPKSAGVMRQPGMDRAVQAPAREQKQKAMKAPVGAVAREAGNQEAPPAASPMLSAAAPSPPVLNMILRAHDPAAAAEVTDLLKRLGGQVDRRQILEGCETLFATIQSEKLDTFREKLKSLGTIQEKPSVPSLPAGQLSIHIEILPE